LDILKEDISHQQVPAAIIIDKLQDSIHRVQNTISRLTDVIRLEKNPYDDIERLFWHQVLDEVILENEEVIRISGASITTNFQVKEIEYSHDGLKSILYNLIINAIKYADPSRSPEIELVTTLKEGRVMLHVIDNGLGIDLEKHRDRLFGLFKRLHTHVEGSGIGLYSVKQLVERKGGSVDVQSILGEGSIFIVLF
jgi:signal transduction histidine kinase